MAAIIVSTNPMRARAPLPMMMWKGCSVSGTMRRRLPTSVPGKTIQLSKLSGHWKRLVPAL
jgi:hypothetical protein